MPLFWGGGGGRRKIGNYEKLNVFMKLFLKNLMKDMFAVAYFKLTELLPHPLPKPSLPNVKLATMFSLSL